MADLEQLKDWQLWEIGMWREERGKPPAHLLHRKTPKKTANHVAAARRRSLLR